MKFRMLKIVALLAVARSAVAQPAPDLYPNEKLKKVSAVEARNDVASCQAAAKQYAGEASQADVRANNVKAGVRGAARGAALGAVAGQITKSGAGRGAGAGAAVGGIHSTMNARKEQREGSPEYKQYVTACLEDKGYKVMGWK